MKREKLWPPYLWRYLVQQSFQKCHPEAPVMVGAAYIRWALGHSLLD